MATRTQLVERMSSYTFDRSAVEYITECTGSPLNLDNYDYAALFLSKKYPKEQQPKILDVGCFIGLFVDFLRREGYDSVFGAENSIKFVEAAGKIGIKIGHVDARSLSVHFEKNYFDIIFCIRMIHNDDNRPSVEVNRFIIEVFYEAYKVLKENGTFFVSSTIPLPLGMIDRIGFSHIRPSFSEKTKNYIFVKKKRGDDRR